MHSLIAVSLIFFLATLAPFASQPAAGSPAAEATARAIAWLHSQQLPDGGFGQAPASGSGAQSAGRSNASATADVIYTLARLGEDLNGPTWKASGHGPLDALAVLAPPYARADAGQAGKVARAVALAGGNPRSFGGLDLVALIQAAYDPATGRYNPDLLFRHSLAVEAIALAGAGVPPPAFDALLSARLADGSWFWAFDGSTGDVDTTGRVVQVLAAYSGLRCAPAWTPTIDYLAARQTADGWSSGSQPGPANANSTALAVGALRSAGVDPEAYRYRSSGPGALQSLLAYQEPSGAFVYTHDPTRAESRLMATLDALNALAPDQPPSCRPIYLPVVLAGR